MRGPIAVVGGFLAGVVAVLVWQLASAQVSLPSGVGAVHECSADEMQVVYAAVDRAYASDRADVRFVHDGERGTFFIRDVVSGDDSVAAREVSGTLAYRLSSNAFVPAKCAAARYRCARGMPWETELFHASPCS